MKSKEFGNIIYVMLAVAIVVIAFNQISIMDVTASVQSAQGKGSKISDVDFSAIKGTGYSIASVFPVQDIQSAQDAIDMMIPTGTPEYADVFENKVNFDDPVSSLDYLSKDAYPKLKNYVKTNDPETWKRYVDLATKPIGISCEFCCGVGPIGITDKGDLRCGCQHNPAVQAITLGLMEYTDYSDSQILYEVMRWKTLFFPKDMINLAMTVAGGDTSQLDNLPGMVGGC